MQFELYSERSNALNTELIKMVISTLDTIEVKGRDNMDKLLGCINALETVVQSAEIQHKLEKEEANG